MNHLTQEELVLQYYGEAELDDARRAHLEACETCSAESVALAAILDRVTPAETPDPGDDYEKRVWDRLQWRLRGEKKKARPAWMQYAAVAVVATVAFLAGIVFRAPAPKPVASSTTATNTASLASNGTQNGKASTRVLLVVVGEHFDESERVLVELTNLTPQGETDITNERERAEALLASNRLYRRSAVDRGEEDVATLLDELEPVLLQIAHAPATLSEDELRSIQKRVEAKGLVFKLRVVRADVRRSTGTPTSI